MQRRRLIQTCLGAAVLAPWARAAGAAPPPLALLVAGPDGDLISRWGNAAALAMGGNFAGAPGMITQPDGGLDGVTGANRLDALVVPDGTTAAILPGAALIAWLTGDPRVHFDPTRFVPLLAATGSGVLVVRGTSAPSLADLRAMAPLRLAADAPQSSDLAVLLALERIGVNTAPVFGLHGADAKTRAFVAGAVDAVFLVGEGVPEDTAPLAASGGVPVFSLEADPLFPALPDLAIFSGAAAAALDASYFAAAAAARLDFIMVLPKLSEPAAVSQWRAAAAAAIVSPAMAAAARASSVTLVDAPTAVQMMQTVAAAQSHQARLQAFLVQRFGWQPG